MKKILYVFPVLVVFAILILTGRNHKVIDPRWDNCVEEMNSVIPDPNDDSRASFLKNCYEYAN